MLRTKQVARPDRHEDVQDAKHKRRLHQPYLGDEPEGKQQRRGQSTQTVERQDLRDQVGKRELVFEDTQHQRNLQPYQDSGKRDPRVEHYPKRVEFGERHKEKPRRRAHQ